MASIPVHPTEHRLDTSVAVHSPIPVTETLENITRHLAIIKLLQGAMLLWYSASVFFFFKLTTFFISSYFLAK